MTKEIDRIIEEINTFLNTKEIIEECNKWYETSICNR